MQHWFDPIAIAIVFLGTLVAAVLRCGLVDARLALATLRSLTQPAFDPVKAKAEVAKQITEIASDGFIRAEPRHFGDQEFDRLADIMISQRSVASLHGEHSKYRRRRADVASRATRFLDCAAELAPVMGLAGTLIALGSARGGSAVAGTAGSGLVESIAMAVVTTLYGLLAANFLFAPLSAAVQRRARAEERDRDAVLDWLENGVRKIDKKADGAPAPSESASEPNGPKSPKAKAA